MTDIIIILIIIIIIIVVVLALQREAALVESTALVMNIAQGGCRGCVQGEGSAGCACLCWVPCDVCYSGVNGTR